MKKDYKKQYYILLFSLPILLFLIYLLTINKTLNLKDRNRKIEYKILKGKNSSLEINHLRYSLKKLYRVIPEKDFRREQNVFSNISNYCKSHHLLVSSFPYEHKIQKGDYLYKTKIIEVEGQFKNHILLLDYLERKMKYSIRSVGFRKLRDRYSRKIVLKMKIYLQEISNEK